MCVWFLLHHFPIPQYFLRPSKKLLPTIVISSIFFFPDNYPLVLVVNISPVVYILSLVLDVL